MEAPTNPREIALLNAVRSLLTTMDEAGNPIPVQDAMRGLHEAFCAYGCDHLPTVGLYDAEGKKDVATIYALPFQKGPDVILWGNRTFVCRNVDGEWRFCEAFAFAAVLGGPPRMDLYIPPERLAQMRDCAVLKPGE